MLMQKLSWETTYKQQLKLEESCCVGKRSECSLVSLGGCLPAKEEAFLLAQVQVHTTLEWAKHDVRSGPQLWWHLSRSGSRETWTMVLRWLSPFFLLSHPSIPVHGPCHSHPSIPVHGQCHSHSMSIDSSVKPLCHQRNISWVTVTIKHLKACHPDSITLNHYIPPLAPKVSSSSHKMKHA